MDHGNVAGTRPRRLLQGAGLHAIVKAGQVLCCYLLGLLKKRQQVGIDLVGVGCGHPVRETRIYF